MYIKYNNNDYPCTCQPSKNTVIYRGLNEDFPYPASGEIILCANDGFVMRTDNTADYLRQTFENGVLTLTNIPEPVEPAEPVEPEEPVEPTDSDLEARVSAIEEAIKKGLSL